MAKHIGRLINVGLGIESTRWTVASPFAFIPKTDYSFEDKGEPIMNESSMGTIADVSGSELSKTFAEGEISGVINDKGIGVLLTAGMGALPTTTLVETGVYKHEFAVAENNEHKSLTIHVADPNVGDRAFPLAMLDELTLSASEGEFATFTASFRSKPSSASATITPSYYAELPFVSRKCFLAVGANYSEVSSATTGNTCVKTMEVTISKNLEDRYCLGSLSPNDILNRQFSISGSFTGIFDSNTLRADQLAGTQKAIRIGLVSAKTIDADTPASVYVDIPLATLTDVSRSMGNDELVEATFEFTGTYSLADSAIANIILTNSVASYA